MRKIRLLALAGLFLTMVWSCDKIEPPYTEQPDSEEPIEFDGKRKVLLEKFTGHRCVNCPAGDETSKALKEAYGDRLVLLSIHYGFFAQPLQDPYVYDFRTTEGSELGELFGVSSLPIGMVNRVEVEGSRLLSIGAWGAAISEFEEDALFGLKIIPGGDALSSFQAEVLVQSNTDTEDSYFLSVLLVEDKIIKPQASGSEGDILNYEHNNVLRKSITGVWGEELSSASITSGDMFEKDYSFSLDSEWNPDNMHIIAMVYNADTYEVMQVERVKLIE